MLMLSAPELSLKDGYSHAKWGEGALVGDDDFYLIGFQL